MAAFTSIFGFPVLLIGLFFTFWAGVWAYKNAPTESELTKLMADERAALMKPKALEPQKPRKRKPGA